MVRDSKLCELTASVFWYRVHVSLELRIINQVTGFGKSLLDWQSHGSQDKGQVKSCYHS